MTHRNALNTLELVTSVLYGFNALPAVHAPSRRMVTMKVVSVALAIALVASPALAHQPYQPIRESAERTALAAAAEQDSFNGRRTAFWAGLALGIAGVTTAVLGTTVYRVEDNSTGNAPPSAYLACVAQKKDPVYASNQCDGLKAKNVKLLASGAALGAVGAVLMIAGAHTSAELGPGVIRVVHRIRF